MSLKLEELDQFHKFASAQIDKGGTDSLYDLVDQWEADRLTDQQLQRNARAIQQAVDDMHAGDTGRPAREVLAELRAKSPTS